MGYKKRETSTNYDSRKNSEKCKLVKNKSSMTTSTCRSESTKFTHVSTSEKHSNSQKNSILPAKYNETGMMFDIRIYHGYI